MELWSACLVAFVVVFGLLAFLALAMSAITALFPAREAPVQQGDAALIAAITAAVTAAIPGSRVTRVEEER